MSEQLQRGLHPDADLLNALAEGALPEHERAQCLEHLSDCARCREIVFVAQGVDTAAHPDAESLNAFVEGVLPGEERTLCLAHLAECARCREIVFAAGEAAPATVIPMRRPWRMRVPVWVAAAVAALVLLGVWLAPRGEKKMSTPVAVMESPAPQQQEPAPAMTGSPRVIGKPLKKYAPPATVRSRPERAELPEAPVLSPEAVAPPAQVAQVEIREYRAPASEGARIVGTVTDASGAVVPGASVTLAQRDGTRRANAQTDPAGRFTLEGLPRGEYDLRIEMPGFKSSTHVVDLRAAEVAVSSRLEVGSVTETVDVTAATPAIQTSTSSAARSQPRPLPSKLPVQITAVSGKVILAVDSAGSLFRSTSAGRKWKKVKPRWSGRVDDVEPRESAISAFALTTESGVEWLSRDGEHWFPAPPEP